MANVTVTISKQSQRRAIIDIGQIFMWSGNRWYLQAFERTRAISELRHLNTHATSGFDMQIR
jgi:hypothetical protein